MSKGNCARKGYKTNCEGVFSNRKSGKPYKYCNECRREMREDLNPNNPDRAGSKGGKTYKCHQPYPTPDKYIYGIYNIYSKEIVYIGESDAGRSRIYKHFTQSNDAFDYNKERKKCLMTNKYKREYYWYHVLWKGSDDDHRLYNEKELILLHQPKYNKEWQ